MKIFFNKKSNKNSNNIIDNSILKKKVEYKQLMNNLKLTTNIETKKYFFKKIAIFLEKLVENNNLSNDLIKRIDNLCNDKNNKSINNQLKKIEEDIEDLIFGKTNENQKSEKEKNLLFEKDIDINLEEKEEQEEQEEEKKEEEEKEKEDQEKEEKEKEEQEKEQEEQEKKEKEEEEKQKKEKEAEKKQKEEQDQEKKTKDDKEEENAKKEEEEREKKRKEREEKRKKLKEDKAKEKNDKDTKIRERERERDNKRGTGQKVETQLPMQIKQNNELEFAQLEAEEKADKQEGSKNKSQKKQNEDKKKMYAQDAMDKLQLVKKYDGSSKKIEDFDTKQVEKLAKKRKTALVAENMLKDLGFENIHQVREVLAITEDPSYKKKLEFIIENLGIEGIQI